MVGENGCHLCDLRLLRGLHLLRAVVLDLDLGTLPPWKSQAELRAVNF